MALPPKIKEWLNVRGITDAVIEANHLDWNGSQIVIPIFNPQGEFLFNKYRRDPLGPEDVPKYTYEKGASAQLFNAHKISSTPGVIICEGEMDVLRLEVEGYVAVSSTGGAGTFKDEWLPLLADKEICICFDNDEAGMKGATKLLTKLPAKIVFIPRQEGIKDITDFLQSGRSFASLLINAESYPLLSEPVPEFKFIKDVKAQIKKYSYLLEYLLVKERNAKNNSKPFVHFDYIRQLLLNAIDNLKREIRKMRYFKKPADIKDNDGRITNEDVRRAKEVPIETLYAGLLFKRNSLAVGKCPFHNETTASFTIYLTQNKFYCFGCSAGTDAIDFIMRRDDCDFITAVRKLINK